MRIPLLSQTRLVGGTSLALQYGHRNSVDLDLFGTVTTDESALRTALASVGKTIPYGLSENIKSYHIDGIKVDFVNYPYDWISPVVESDGIRLASPADIAAMKVNAITNRGSRKDFIDMYFLLKNYTLKDVLRFYQQKYVNISEFMALRSLTYFEDAEINPMPVMFVNIGWEEMKKSITHQVEKYINSQ